MLVLDAKQTSLALPWAELIEAIKHGFQQDCITPLRHQHVLENANEPSATLLLMPAWVSGQHLGIKQVMVVPGNSARGLPGVQASYQLFSAKTGELLAILEGTTLTNKRTAAASALASSFLSKQNSQHLLIVGTGALARWLVQAHISVRPIKHVSIWGRDQDKAVQMTQELKAERMNTHGIKLQPVSDLCAAAKRADIISCATMSHAPLVLGQWLSPGTHLDLVGGFTPDMRETDDTAISRSQIYVDTFEGALEEAGDIIQAINSKVISKNDIKGDLFGLCKGDIRGRQNDEHITAFKSVGTALEDLAAAELAYRQSQSLSV